ncbi:MAG: GGDEF domain-containing protein [Alcanivoracaceae bacterium]|nr:GGDEF domain-containing protein [Alcanivoracaceae bacterium]
MNLPNRIASEHGLAWVRTAARLLFAGLVLSYFLMYSNAQSAITSHLLFWGYIIAQGVLLIRAVPGRENLAMLLDAIAITFAVALDPSTPPPTLALFLISVISAGMLRGLGRFFLILLANTALIAVLIALRHGKPTAFESSSAFLLATIAACAVYLGVLIYRNKILTRLAQEATWKDPETGLISHHALVATAGWLLPLHDRLAANLTVVLISPAQAGTLTQLADNLAQRLRKSDIAARYEDVIALLLPCTTLTAAENLLSDVRESTQPFYASITTLTNDQHGLEETLVRLEHHLGRAVGNAEHWLAHAPVQSA